MSQHCWLTGDFHARDEPKPVFFGFNGGLFPSIGGVVIGECPHTYTLTSHEPGDQGNIVLPVTVGRVRMQVHVLRPQWVLSNEPL